MSPTYRNLRGTSQTSYAVAPLAVGLDVTLEVIPKPEGLVFRDRGPVVRVPDVLPISRSVAFRASRFQLRNSTMEQNCVMSGEDLWSSMNS